MTTVGALTQEELRKAAPPAGDEQGFGALSTDKGPLPLKALAVSGEVTGLQYRIRVKQTFVNTHAEPLEATYLFPLPDRAAVSRFTMTVGKREIEGVLKERAAARREYTQALQAGHRAAIAEEERPNVFSMRAGNILPNEHAIVELTLDGPLSLEGGEATFRFPLVVAPRYIPGTPLPGDQVGDGVAEDTDAVPDASRISPPVLLPGFPNPVRLSIELDVDPAGLPFKDYRSSLHAVAGEGLGQGRMKLKLQPGERLDRDFILRFQLGSETVSTALNFTPDAKDKGEGTFTLTLVPPSASERQGAAGRDARPTESSATAASPSVQRPRDILFVLDRSGSMEGWKMVAARRAMARMVETLTERDRFDIFAFDDTVESFRGSNPGGPARGERAFWAEGVTAPAEHGPFIAANDRNRVRAVEFLSKIESRGGTELARPLIDAVTRLADQAAASAPSADAPTRERILVLATDGQVGNESQILREIAPKLAGIRVFALGIDRAVNEAFLKQLAQAGGGAMELVESEERLDEVMDRVHRKIGTPVLTELKLDAQGVTFDAESIAPQRLPDLFADAPVVIQGRYKGAPRGLVELRANDAGGKPWSAKISGTESANEAARKIWARANLRDLEDRVAAERVDASALQRRILELSLAHGVLCRYTAFVAVDRAEIVNKGGQAHQVLQPVEQPEGWEQKRATGMFNLAGGPAMAVRCAAPMAARALASMPPPPAPKAEAPTTGKFLHAIFGQASKAPEPVNAPAPTTPPGAAAEEVVFDAIELLPSKEGLSLQKAAAASRPAGPGKNVPFDEAETLPPDALANVSFDEAETLPPDALANVSFDEAETLPPDALTDVAMSMVLPQEPAPEQAPAKTAGKTTLAPAVVVAASGSRVPARETQANMGAASAKAFAGLSATFWALLTAILVAVGMLIAWYLFLTPKEGLTPPEPQKKEREKTSMVERMERRSLAG
ncbi:MAG: VWA domain-containing protein [Planctomycetes bacterium]|nr:VWA domain-containing protein [Planctomycetota bacterium]